MTSFDIQLGPVRGVPLYLLLADTCFLSWRAASCGTGSVETPGKAYIMPSAFLENNSPLFEISTGVDAQDFVRKNR